MKHIYVRLPVSTLLIIRLIDLRYFCIVLTCHFVFTGILFKKIKHQSFIEQKHNLSGNIPVSACPRSLCRSFLNNIQHTSVWSRHNIFPSALPVIVWGKLWFQGLTINTSHIHCFRGALCASPAARSIRKLRCALSLTPQDIPGFGISPYFSSGLQKKKRLTNVSEAYCM